MRESEYFGRNAAQNTDLRHAEAAGSGVGVSPHGAPGYGSIVPPSTTCDAVRSDGEICTNTITKPGHCFGHRVGPGKHE